MNNILSNISGFPEFTPEAQIVFNNMISIISESYEFAGAIPLETAAVERVEDLLKKGGNDKEIYGLRRLKDDDEEAKNYALRFDLTTPMGRYVAQNKSRLVFPFKRYQVQPVWRGERAQKGRYKQFIQADIDVIGNEKLSIIYDAEMPATIYQIFRKLAVGPFVISINNRKILTGLLNYYGITDNNNIIAAINTIDDLEKKGLSEITTRLTALGIAQEKVNDLLSLFSLDFSTDKLLTYLASKDYGDIFSEGVVELQQVIAGIRSFGVPDAYFKADLSIARGLDYYTGTIYETRLTNSPQIGSVCSGGRYDNLVNDFCNNKKAGKMPGVGISIGISRLISQLFDSGVIEVGRQSIAPVMLTTMDKKLSPNYIEITAMLRKYGIKTDIYLEDKKLAKQITYANKKGFPFVIIAGQDELDKNQVNVREMKTGEQSLVSIDELAEFIKGSEYC